ncbi:MAG: tRNA (cytidine(34)-2'-O)-methyltransferase [Christensenellaceae bacterium]|jgi:tRNA (cytidine/uridine-2'-O-)-methyltransferase
MAINVVLVKPQIPQNTGNIARTCVVTGSVLHLVGPMGFSLNEKHLKRAGLDYWPDLTLHTYENLDAFMALHGEKDLWLFSSKAQKSFADAAFFDDCSLLFGSETEGLGEELVLKNRERSVCIPMANGQRCLNLSNAACTAVYEALRQNGYLGLH